MRIYAIHGTLKPAVASPTELLPRRGPLISALLQVLGVLGSHCGPAACRTCTSASTSPLLAGLLPARFQAFRAAPTPRRAAGVWQHSTPGSQQRRSSCSVAASGVFQGGSAPVEKLQEVAVRAAQAGAAVSIYACLLPAA